MGAEGILSRDAALTARGLSVRFSGITALEDVSFQLASGEVLGVIGPNGAGKTTLFNVICGFVQPQSGSIQWEGTTLTKVRPDRLASLGIARTLQGVGLFLRLTVLENVMLGAQPFRGRDVAGALLGLPRADRAERLLRERALAILTDLGCEHVASRLPSTLPYPLQKRVALARALVGEPRLLLLDEPAGGLGADEVAELVQRIRSLRGSMAVMLVEHRMDLVMSVCDRVAVLDFGHLIAEGDPPTIRRDPRVLEAYLGREATDPLTAEQRSGP